VVVTRRAGALDATAVIDGLKGRIANYKVPKRVFVVEDCRATRWARCRRTCCATATSARSRHHRDHRPELRRTPEFHERHRQNRFDEAGLAIGVGIAVEAETCGQSPLQLGVAL